MECGDRRSSSTTPAISSLGRSNLEPVLPDGRAAKPARRLSHGYRETRCGLAYSLAQRYQLGLNIALPADWAMQVYFSHTKDKNYNTEDPRRNSLSKAAVSAALGWTIPATAVSGTTPAIATWTKPANVPYLNLFCDPRAYTCNSPATLNYLQRIRRGSGVHAYQGARHQSRRPALRSAWRYGQDGHRRQLYHLQLARLSRRTRVQPTRSSTLSRIARNRQVWAAFTQLNIPIFSDQNALPLLRRLDFEFVLAS